MADNDVRIKVSLDGDKLVIDGLEGIGDSAGKADSKLGSFVGKGLKGAGVALAGFATAAIAGATALSVGVVKAYADYEQNIGGIETMFGSASDKMMKYASDAYMTAGLSANQYMEQVTSFSAALLQGLGGDTAAAAEVANQAMVDMSDNANKFGSNIQDIQNAYQGFAKQNYTMLDNLKLGYGGTASEMARLINDSGVLGDTMEVTAQTVNDVSFDKIIEAINVVQTEMGITGTTALEAEETISGALGMLSASYENLLTGLGDADADVGQLAGNMIRSFELVVTNISPVIENIGDHMATLGPQMGSMIGSLVDAIVTAIPGLISAGSSMIEGLIQGVASALPSLIEAAVPAIAGLVDMIASQLPLLIDAGMKAVIALGEGLVQAVPDLLPSIALMITGIVDGIITNLPMLLDVALQLIQALADGLIQSLPILIGYLPELISQIISFFYESLPLLIQTGIDLFVSLVEALPEIITMIVEVIPDIIDSVITAILDNIPVLIDAGFSLFTALVDNLPQIIVTIIKAIPQIISSIVNALVNSFPKIVQSGFDLLKQIVTKVGEAARYIAGKIPEIITSIGDAIGQGWSTLVDAGKNLMRGVWDGISSMGDWLWNRISGFFDGIWNNVLNFFGIQSPSTLFRDELGKQLIAGAGIGITANADLVLNPIEDLNKKILQQATDLPQLSLSSAVGGGADAAMTYRSVATESVSAPALYSTALRPLIRRDADSVARISSSDMDMLASRVASALVRVRHLDSRDAQLALMQEVR